MAYNPYIAQQAPVQAGGLGTTPVTSGVPGASVDGSAYQVQYSGANGASPEMAAKLAGMDANQQAKVTEGQHVWGQTANAAKPWLTNSQAAADTRNNFYYGGSANGAANFNNTISGVSAGQTANFANDASNATNIGNNAAASLNRAVDNGAQAGAQMQMAQQRDPSQFIDQNSYANNSADRGAQLQAIQGLQNTAGGLSQYIANGPGPSAAQAQLNQATNANMANSLALARSGRGMGQSQSALRQAIGQNAQTQQQAVNQSAVLRAQEAQNWQQNQLGAYGQLGNVQNAMGGVAANARAGDVSQGSYLTGSLQNSQNANDQTSLGYGQLQQGYGTQSLNAVGQQLNANGQAIQANTASAQNQNSLLGLQNSVNNGALNGNMQFEGQQLGSYLGQRQPIQNNGTDYTPYIQAGATVLGAAAML